METSYIAPNLLNREFRQHGPRKVLLTDITYEKISDAGEREIRVEGTVKIYAQISGGH